MNSNNIIETKCIDCQSYLAFDELTSTFRCPKCYDPIKIFTVWCPFCGSHNLAEYTNNIMYRCRDCGKIYHLWDSSLILNKVIKRLNELERKINNLTDH